MPFPLVSDYSGVPPDSPLLMSSLGIEIGKFRHFIRFSVHSFYGHKVFCFIWWLLILETSILDYVVMYFSVVLVFVLYNFLFCN